MDPLVTNCGVDPMTELKGIPPMDPVDPAGAILRWRFELLVDAGLDELSARRAAADPRVDLHARMDSERTGR